MREERFVQERAARWRELQEIVDRRAGLRFARFGAGEVRRFAALYRLAATDLAVARTLRYSDATTRPLNRLCAAAHGAVYGAGRTGALAAAGSTLVEAFPRAFRATLGFHAAAAAAFVIGTIATWILFADDPDLAERTFGATLRQRAVRAAAMSDDTRRYIEMRGAFAPVFAWGIIAHNVRAALTAFGLGAVSAIGGLLVVFATAATVGAGLAVFDAHGVAEVLLTFMAAHGPMELTAIFVMTGAGMRVGLSILLPGRRTRGAAFRAASSESLPLLLGATALLVAAGLLEGLVSPGPLAPAWKWGIGAATAVFTFLWLGFAGRSPRAAA